MGRRYTVYHSVITCFANRGLLHFIIRIRLPQHKKTNTEWCWSFCGGGGRIRTIEAIRSRFTVCQKVAIHNVKTDFDTTIDTKG